jgi:hypothetical protein
VDAAFLAEQEQRHYYEILCSWVLIGRTYWPGTIQEDEKF